MTEADRQRLTILRRMELRALRRDLREDAASVLPRLDPVRFRWGFPPDAPRTSILAHYLRTPPVCPGRRPYRLLVEGARGSGKTEIAREVALHRLLDGAETGVLYLGRTPPDSAAQVRPYLSRLPPLRRSDDPNDPRLRDWLASPLGRLYPSARITGGVEHAAIHVEGRIAHVWSRAPGGSIRGLNERGVRPSLVIPDDLVTLEAALSTRQTDSLEAILDDDVGGLGTVDCPVAIWLLGNAVAQGDLLDRAAASGRWTVCRAPSWTPTIPPDSPHKRELLRLLTSRDATAEDGVRYLGQHRDEVLQGCRATDPAVEPIYLLQIEAAIGTRAFRRAYQCERLSSDDRLLAMDRAVLVDIIDGDLHWTHPDGAKAGPPVLLSSCRAGIWLDPRGIEDAARGDWAAVALCVREPGPADRARRACLRIDLARCNSRDQRAMLWTAFDHAVDLGIPVRNIRVGYETNMSAKLAHETFLAADIIERRAQKALTPPAGIEGAWSSKGKCDIDRIGGLEGPIESGRFGFARTLQGTEAWRQHERLPHGDHDDAADAVAYADGLTVAGTPSLADLAAFMRR